MNNPYGSSDFTANNPFVASAHSRFPDIAASPSPANDPAAAQFTQWLQPGPQSPVGFQQPQAPFQQQPYQQQMSPGPQFGAGFPPQQGFQSPTAGFQPTSAFGQQMASQISGSSYGYLQGQSMAPAPSGYNPAQQQLQNNPGYLAQFDPYASVGQGWDGTSQHQQPSVLSPASPGGAPTTSPTGQLHPREYIRVHKNQIESWDSYTWKQLLNTFDVLKDAWEARKKDINGNIAQLQQQLQYAGYYAPGQLQQEIARLQTMAKDAESNHDSVAASSFQMHEVLDNYRQSTDVAGKSMVREASNAALASLPDWPPLAY